MTRTATIAMTTEQIAQAIWNCAAAEVCAIEAQRIGGKDIYPDPGGNCTAVDPYTGTKIRGWHAPRLTGEEVVQVSDTGTAIRFAASEFVLGRIGQMVSGREGRRLRAVLG